MIDTSQKISPFLWFENNAEEAANFYTSVFENSKITHVARYGEAGPGPVGTAMTVAFELEGTQFTALNGGVQEFPFTMAISFVVKCNGQQEVDRIWDALLKGGKAAQCGWLTDKFGITWQIVPTEFLNMLGDGDPVRMQRVLTAMFQMVKLDLPTLKKAYDGQ